MKKNMTKIIPVTDSNFDLDFNQYKYLYGTRLSAKIIPVTDSDFDMYQQKKDLRKHEPVLDKIREEIADTGAYEQEVHGKTEFLKGIDYCLSVIDRYAAESEAVE